MKVSWAGVRDPVALMGLSMSPFSYASIRSPIPAGNPPKATPYATGAMTEAFSCPSGAAFPIVHMWSRKRRPVPCVTTATDPDNSPS
jgi:hypothetical protein